MTEDVAVLPTGEGSVTGREALRSHHRSLFDSFSIVAKHEPIETQSFGDIAIQWGNSNGSFTPMVGGEAVPFDQKYLFVFLRQADTSFNLWRAIFNDNAPTTARREALARPVKSTLRLPEITREISRLPEQPLWNSVRAWHYNPRMVRPLWEVWEALAEPPLDLRIKVMVAAVTDSRNRCPYCLSSAVCFLEQEGVPEDVILALQSDITAGAFSEKEKALLLPAEQMTLNPSSAHARVGPALEVGWTEDEVAQAIFVAAYFNMLNRIAEAFAFPADEDHPFETAPKFPVSGCAR